VRVAAQGEAGMEWLFVALLLAITILAWLQLDSLYRIQAMNVSLLEIAHANSKKKVMDSWDITEAIKRASNNDNIAGEIVSFKNEVYKGLGKIEKGIAAVDLSISSLESGR
jgi:hypothetical protein